MTYSTEISGASCSTTQSGISPGNYSVDYTNLSPYSDAFASQSAWADESQSRESYATSRGDSGMSRTDRRGVLLPSAFTAGRSGSTVVRQPGQSDYSTPTTHRNDRSSNNRARPLTPQRESSIFDITGSTAGNIAFYGSALLLGAFFGTLKVDNDALEEAWLCNRGY